MTSPDPRPGIDPAQDRDPSLSPPASPTLAQAFPFWLRLGFLSFGGPAGQIALLHAELVERRRWISERRFLHALNYCMLLPGPEAIQLATYISWLQHGARGAFLAGILFFLPGFLLLCVLAWAYLDWGGTPIAIGVFHAIKPAVVAVVVAAAWRMGRRSLRSPLLRLVALAAFLGIAVLGIGYPWIVLGAALAGVLGMRLWPAQFPGGEGHAAARPGADARPAAIDDTTPTPAHARWSALRTLLLVSAFLAAWGLVLLLVRHEPDLLAMAWFFTKVAFLTFGGAYAVLPYVYGAAVDRFGWLTGPQMMDGLALGETTPGPLILVVTWVGWLGGVAHHVLPHPVLAGLAGAGIATYFTLLPSFLFIVAGGPIVEATRGELRLAAPLMAIGAAVVGVILSLALVFGWHTFWPHASIAAPFSGGIDGSSLLLAALCLLALRRWHVGVVPLIAVCALVGLVSGMLS